MQATSNQQHVRSSPGPLRCGGHSCDCLAAMQVSKALSLTLPSGLSVSQSVGPCTFTQAVAAVSMPCCCCCHCACCVAPAGRTARQPGHKGAGTGGDLPPCLLAGGSVAAAAGAGRQDRGSGGPACCCCWRQQRGAWTTGHVSAVFSGGLGALLAWLVWHTCRRSAVDRSGTMLGSIGAHW